MLVVPLQTLAQDEVVSPECRPFVAPVEAVRFDGAEHQLWYRRFWTGECKGLHLCLAGQPNWTTVFRRVMARTPSSEAEAVKPRLCRLGAAVGLEFSRDDNIRRINTGNLRAYVGMLYKQPDVAAAVDQVARDAGARLGQTF